MCSPAVIGGNLGGARRVFRVFCQCFPRRRQLAAERAPRRPELDEGVLLRREVGVPGVAAALDVVHVDPIFM